MCERSDELRKISKQVVNIINGSISHKGAMFSRPFFDTKISRIVFDECQFEKIDLQNVTFDNCEFRKCKFDCVMIQDGCFMDCELSTCKFIDTTLDVKFEKCILITTQFIHCNAMDDVYSYEKVMKNEGSLLGLEKGPRSIRKNISFMDVEFFMIDFNDVDLQFSIFKGCQIDGIEFYNNTNLIGARFEKVKETFIVLFQCKKRLMFPEYTLVLNQYPVIFNEQTYFPTYKEAKQLAKKSDKRKLIGLVNSYDAIYSSCRNNNFDINMAGDYYYTYKALLGRTFTGVQKLKSIFYKSINGYGEKWKRGMVWSLILIVASAFLYLSGLQVNDTFVSDGYIIQYQIDFKSMGTFDFIKFVKDFASCLYFSIMTFTTVGYGNMQAIGIISNIISSVQMLVGVFLMTITTGTLLRRIIR